MDSNRNPEMHKNHNMDVTFGPRLLLELGSHSWASMKYKTKISSVLKKILVFKKSGSGSGFSRKLGARSLNPDPHHWEGIRRCKIYGIF